MIIETAPVLSQNCSTQTCAILQSSFVEQYYTESKALHKVYNQSSAWNMHMPLHHTWQMLEQHVKQQLTLKDSQRLAERVMFMTAPAQST